MTHLLESTVHQIFEAKKLIKTLTNGKYTAKVYYDPEWEEYQTKFFEDGKDLGEDVMHHTDDKNDAINTAEAELKFMAKSTKNESKKLKENMQMHPNKIEGFMESMEEKFDSRPFKEVLKDLDNNFDAGLVKAWEKMAKDFDAFSEVFWEKYT